MKAQPMILRGTVAEVAAELRRRASQADTLCLTGLAALLLAAACTPGPHHPASAPAPQAAQHVCRLDWQFSDE